MIQLLILALGAIFAFIGIVLFAKKGIQGQNTIKMLGAEFELAGSSLVIFVLGCMLIIVAANLSGTGGPSQGSSHADGAEKTAVNTSSKPVFTTRFTFDAEEDLQRTAYEITPGPFAGTNLDEFLDLAEFAFGEAVDTARQTSYPAFNLRLRLTNPKDEPIFLDLGPRFFTMEDDLGRQAELMYFCCPSDQETLGSRQSRDIQLLYKIREEWIGKELASDWLYLQVRGLMPVERATWRFPPIATAD